MVSDKVYEDTRIRLAIVAKRKMTGVDPGLDFHSTVVRVLLLLLFYSIVSFSFLRRIYKNQGNVFARVVYMPRWSCILSLYDSTVLSVYTSGIQQIGKRPNNKTNQVSLHQ
jgi:hypothetical protein